MNFEISVLPEESDPYQIVNAYIKNSYPSYNKDFVSKVFVVRRTGEQDTMNSKWKPELSRALLWHGTKKSNVVGVLQDGFRIKPSDVQSTGSLFGEGIYFTD
jgi:poly [ADP-ribose] polymerase 1